MNNQFIKEFSVTEISNLIKRLLEAEIGFIRIKGEISGLKIATSGHCYFNLKDNLSVLACTCWRTSMSKVNFKLEDGMEIVVVGKVTSYAGQSKYQVSVEKIEPVGIGTLMQILKERKEKLEKEGLFAPENKKSLPFLPQKIGVVTSITGAVIQDIIHRVRDRFPVCITIWPVTVQGDSAAAEISAAIDGFNDLEETLKPDLIIVARGGGSIEDLYAFNEEIVVRSVAMSTIPIISAVGHETDYTLIDMAADVRAPTPTAAAEMALPQLSALYNTLEMHDKILLSTILQFIKYRAQTVNSYRARLQYQTYYLDIKAQKIDELSLRLIDAMPDLLRLKSKIIKQITNERLNPSNKLRYFVLQLKNAYHNLNIQIENTLQNRRHNLSLHSTLLASLDHKNTLKRGFAILKTNNNKIISSFAEIKSVHELSVQLYDGEFAVVVKHEK